MSEVSQSAPIHTSEATNSDTGENPVKDVAATAAAAASEAAGAEAVEIEGVAVAAFAEAEAAESAAAEAFAEAAEVEAEALEAYAEADAVEAMAVDTLVDVEAARDAGIEPNFDAEVAEAVAIDAIAAAEVVKAESAEIIVEAEAVEAEATAEIVEAEIVEAAAVEAVVLAEAVAEDASAEADSDGKRVRTLAVGQEVMGTVKRVSDFGAFVDIGVGRDGLVHISELSVKRVGKVTDVINEGQVVPMWIKKLDRERNRISLTMIPPGTKTLRDVNQGDIVMGTVTRILPYGAFVDIGVGRDALLHVREMGERYIARPEEVVQVGETFEVRIIEVQRRRGRIDLSIKGLRPEPEVESAPAAQQSGQASEYVAASKVEAAPQAEAAPEPVDQFADVEIPSAMELALRKAMDQSGVDLKISKKKDKQRAETQRRQQEEIYARTLKTSGK